MDSAQPVVKISVNDAYNFCPTRLAFNEGNKSTVHILPLALPNRTIPEYLTQMGYGELLPTVRQIFNTS